MMNIKINSDKCIGCGACVNACPPGLIEMVEEKAKLVGDNDDCVGCKACETVCPVGAITVI